MTAMDIPEGFQPHFRRSPLTDPWELPGGPVDMYSETLNSTRN